MAEVKMPENNVHKIETINGEDIVIPELPGNAIDDRGRPNETEGVVSAKPHKKTVGEKVKKALTDENANSVLNYVIFKIAVPKAKDMMYNIASETLDTIVDTVTGGLSMKLFGDIKGARNSTVVTHRGFNDYASISKDRGRISRVPETRPIATVRQRSIGYSVDFEFTDRSTAYEVLDRLIVQVKNHRVATVGYLYQLCRQPTTPILFEWGWDDLTDRNAGVRRVGSVFVLDLPEPIALATDNDAPF